MKEFYRKRIIATESGLEIITETWHPIRETECINFCVSSHHIKMFNRAAAQGEKITARALAKRMGFPVKQIHKAYSRFAFDTQAKAFDHMVFLQKRRLGHLERDLGLTSVFLSSANLGFTTVDSTVVPESHDLVHQHYNFD